MKVKVAQLSLTLCNPMDYTVHGILQARILEWVAFPFSRGSSQSRSPALQADSLPAELQGKPKNTGVSSLSLLQRIFPTQESNRGLLHCRWILQQLSYEGSPFRVIWLQGKQIIRTRTPLEWERQISQKLITITKNIFIQFRHVEENFRKIWPHMNGSE